MRTSKKSIFAGIGIFLTTIIAMGISISILMGFAPIPSEWGTFSIFVFISFIILFSLLKFEGLNFKSVLVAVIFPILLIIIPKAINSTANFLIMNIPFFISIGLAIGGSYMFYKYRSYSRLFTMAIFPLVMSFGLQGVWAHKFKFGSFEAERTGTIAPSFKFEDKFSNIITNESLKGKVVVMDFWYISCPNCWQEFPHLQEIYNTYKTNDQVEILAVNRPMRRDQPGQLFTVIEKQDYTFPVVKGTEELMEDFDIVYYPTVIILDQNGKLAFKGSIEDAAVTIDKLLL